MRFKSFFKKALLFETQLCFFNGTEVFLSNAVFIIKLSAFIRALKKRKKVFFAEIKTFSNLTLGKKLILHRLSKNFYFGKVLQEGRIYLPNLIKPNLT